MLLYHFTAAEYLHSILTNGLTKGDVPISPHEGINAVWLTSDPNASEHGLGEARTMTEEDRNGHLAAFGILLPVGSRYPDKRAVRITVKIGSADRHVKRWTAWARKRLTADWLAALNRTGGGERKARTWFICLRPISPDEFVKIEAATLETDVPTRPEAVRRLVARGLAS